MKHAPRWFATVIAGCLLACVQPPASEVDAAKEKQAPEPTPAASPADGRAWIGVDGVGLHVVDERGWRLLLETRAPIRDMLMLDRQLFVLSANGVQRVDESGQAEFVAKIDRDTYSKIGEPVALASEDGRNFQIDGSLGVARYIGGRWELPPDAPTKPDAPQLGPIDGWIEQPLRSIARDASGRVWAGTYNGLVIVTDGEIAEYPISQLSDLAGPVGPILVEGNGPPPPTLGRVRTGGLKGVIALIEGEEKRPQPNVKVEICSRLPSGDDRKPDSHKSTCDSAEETYTTTTDAEGKFEFANLPIDHYWFGVEIGGRWAGGEPKALNMRAGMSGNVGMVAVAVPGPE